MKRPCASKGLTSYRYRGPFGYILIGAVDNKDALNEANRSLEVPNATVDNLEIWNGEKYVKV